MLFHGHLTDGIVSVPFWVKLELMRHQITLAETLQMGRYKLDRLVTLRHNIPEYVS